MHPRLYLESRKLTIKEFGAITRIPYSTIAGYFAGYRRPSLKNIATIKECSNGYITAEDWIKFYATLEKSKNGKDTRNNVLR